MTTPTRRALAALALAAIALTGCGTSGTDRVATTATTTTGLPATTTTAPASTTTAKATTTTTRPPTTTTTRPPTTTTAPSEAAMVKAWSGEHIQVMTDLSESLGGVGNSTTIKDYRLACTDLGEKVAAAQAAPVIPSSAVEGPWRAALADFAAGADLCINGIDQDSPSLITAATARISSGTGHITESTAALKDLIG